VSNDIYVAKDKDILDAFANAPNFNRWMADTIRPYVGNDVLEIGAGMGNLTRLLLPGRKRYVATDLDREHLERLRARLSHRPRLETAELNAADGACREKYRAQMDTVVCLNVLEHIEDDYGALRNIHSMLRDGGRAVILVPCGQSIFNSLDEELGHFRRYSEDQLRQSMTEAGFNVETVLRFNRASRPGWWLNGTVLKRRTIGRIQLKNFDRLVWLVRRIDAYLPWPQTSVIGIGRRDGSACE
jgi:SAM-dependent methyltransferase